MNIRYGDGETEHGRGVLINLSGAEIATAIDAYLAAHRIYVSGPRTIQVNGDLCKYGNVYVDPVGFVIAEGDRYEGGETHSDYKIGDKYTFNGHPFIVESTNIKRTHLMNAIPYAKGLTKDNKELRQLEAEGKFVKIDCGL